ncbi:hypothetical protein GCM10010052_25970 [Paenarthrobacter histidinolovorans]|nr:hypothetical protein GCM10010052_25970 [Paenarthrobacter histidinolovorans]
MLHTGFRALERDGNPDPGNGAYDLTWEPREVRLLITHGPKVRNIARR